MNNQKQQKNEPEYMKRIHFIKDRVVGTRPEMDLENAKIMTESFKETAGEPLCIRKAKAFRIANVAELLNLMLFYMKKGLMKMSFPRPFTILVRQMFLLLEELL